MPIYALGLNHNTAPLSLRERLYFPLEKIPLYLQDLLARESVREAVLLSTCNRTELYVEADDPAILKQWLLEKSGLSFEELEPALYLHEDRAAVAHLMTVSCGFDSLIFGESQILGQLKAAYSESCTAGAVSALFHRLFQEVFQLAKYVRTSTSIGACPVSVASAAFHFAKQSLASLDAPNVVVLGAGDTAELLLRYLTTQFHFSLSLVNRTVEKAVELVRDRSIRVFKLSELEHVLSKADLVFTATGSPTPLITAALMSRVMKTRKDHPITLLDVAVPRDVDPDVHQHHGVSLFCVDDLRNIIDHNRKGREHAAEQAKELIQQKSGEFIFSMLHHDHVSETIRDYRHHIETLCKTELEKAKMLLQAGRMPEEVLEWFAGAVTKKWLHAPSVRLREAGAEGRVDLLSFAKHLFAPLSGCEIKSS